MSDDVQDQILDILGRIDAKLDRIAVDIGDLKTRVTTLTLQIAALATTFTAPTADLPYRLDRIDMRLERIERRLDPVGG